MGIRRELTLRLPNSPGALAGIYRVLADERVTINAMALTVGGHLHLLVDNHTRAAGALRERHHTIVERDVLFVQGRDPNALAAALTLVGTASINVEYSYSGVAEGGHGASVVIGVDDVQRASAATGI